MANIKVVYDGLFIGVPGLYHEVLSLDSPTLGQLVQVLVQRHGTRFREMLYDSATGQFSQQIAVLVNGNRPSPQARLQEADEVAFLVPIAGGALSALPTLRTPCAERTPPMMDINYLLYNRNKQESRGARNNVTLFC